MNATWEAAPTSLAIALLVSVATAAVTASAATGGESGHVVAVEHVDLERYAGLWYEIARLPNRFQDQCAGDVVAEYALRDDGRIDVLNRCRHPDGRVRSAKGVARLSAPDGPRARLQVRFAPAWLSFLGFVWGDYWVIDLAPDYAWSVVGEPGRKYLWVLSRDPDMDEETYRGILERARGQGYDVSRVERTSQSASPPQPR